MTLTGLSLLPITPRRPEDARKAREAAPLERLVAAATDSTPSIALDALLDTADLTYCEDDGHIDDEQGGDDVEDDGQDLTSVTPYDNSTLLTNGTRLRLYNAFLLQQSSLGDVFAQPLRISYNSTDLSMDIERRYR